MKKNLIFLTSFLVLFCLFSIAIAKVEVADREKIEENLEKIEKYVNTGDVNEILNLLSPNADAELELEIKKAIQGRSIEFQQKAVSFKEISQDKIRVKGFFSAKGTEVDNSEWELNGMPNYFVFENVNGKWLLFESDFARKIVPGYVFSIFKNIGKGLGFLFLLSIPFWIAISSCPVLR